MAFISRCAFRRQDVALDVGTASIRLAAGSNRLMKQPSHSSAGHALRAGVITNEDTATNLLKPMLSQVKIFGIVRPCVLACAPSDVSRAERELLVGSIMKAGASSVTIIPEPLAAAVGAGVDVSSPYAHMIIDIGEGVTDCAVIRESKIRSTCAVRGGCAQLRSKIASNWSRSGSLSTANAEQLLRSKGISLSPVHDVASNLADAIALFLKNLPPELGCEIIESGIRLTGGGALVPGISSLIEDRTGITVTTSPTPLSDVIEGARAILPIVAALNRWH
ncbi:rod shape-determining protein [Pelotalea chapellei]|uniref:Rod shape-determining protein n=1 Tax=Pelotalea chapellei TaxID=44671 RepID=A0ABS5UC22_9BACT|nr:rod shape-determining protein [Pelotalea chapellei]MBT1073235.1 rod shape-determining protein [Pelotalea chapellei]